MYGYDWYRLISSYVYVCERKCFQRAIVVARACMLAAQEQQDWYRCAVDAARAYILAAQERGRHFERTGFTPCQ